MRTVKTAAVPMNSVEFENLTATIGKNLPPRQCSENCGGVITECTVFGRQIVFELDLKECITLEQVPYKIELSDKSYFLRGIIHFQANQANKNDVRHYTAYVRRLDSMWELYDDLQSDKIHSRKDTPVNPQCAIYTI